MCLPLKLAKSLGNIDQIVICNRVTTAIQLINPRTLQGEPVTTQSTSKMGTVIEMFVFFAIKSLMTTCFFIN